MENHDIDFIFNCLQNIENKINNLYEGLEICMSNIEHLEELIKGNIKNNE